MPNPYHGLPDLWPSLPKDTWGNNLERSSAALSWDAPSRSTLLPFRGRLYSFAGRDLSRLTTGARSSSNANDLALDVTESIKNDYGESA